MRPEGTHTVCITSHTVHIITNRRIGEIEALCTCAALMQPEGALTVRMTTNRRIRKVAPLPRCNSQPFILILFFSTRYHFSLSLIVFCFSFLFLLYPDLSLSLVASGLSESLVTKTLTVTSPTFLHSLLRYHPYSKINFYRCRTFLLTRLCQYPPQFSHRPFPFFSIATALPPPKP